MAESPPRTNGRRLALQANRRACAAEIVVPVVNVASPTPVLSLSSLMVTTTAALATPCLGRDVGGEVFEEFDERPPHPLPEGQLHRVGLGGRTFGNLEAGAARRGEGFEGGGQHVVLQVRHLPAVAGDPVGTLAAAEAGLLQRPGFVGLQLLGQRLVRGLGVDHLNQMVRQHLQLSVGQGLRMPDQVGFTGLNGRGRQLRRQLVDRSPDHHRLLALTRVRSPTHVGSGRSGPTCSGLVPTSRRRHRSTPDSSPPDAPASTTHHTAHPDHGHRPAPPTAQSTHPTEPAPPTPHPTDPRACGRPTTTPAPAQAGPTPRQQQPTPPRTRHQDRANPDSSREVQR